MYKDLFRVEDLKNSSEEIVFELLHNAVNNEDEHFCQCEICIQDIAAITLNNVPAQYVSNLLDEKNPRRHQRFTTEALRASVKKELKTAIKTVSGNPHH